MFRDLIESAKQQPVASTILVLVLLAGTWLLITATTVLLNSQEKEDSILVLGGSVAREVYAAVLAKKEPNRLTIVSGGEPPLCTRKIFESIAAPVDNVILDRSATNTFENFTYSIPILRRHHAKKTGVITSEGNEQRSVWMARIFLWSNGIAVENKIIPGEFSQVGHNESPLKTALDVIRSAAWAPFSGISPPAGEVVTLRDVIDSTTKCTCQPVPEHLAEEYENDLR
ncbi:MAG: YdcF family protein [Candidatus Obscuribacterales bacterium]|nr:YdcF family protein [Candidatus Obscuribacterales bacterium]